MEIISIKPFQRVDFIEITNEVEERIKKSSVKEGMCYLFVPHTTAYKIKFIWPFLGSYDFRWKFSTWHMARNLFL